MKQTHPYREGRSSIFVPPEPHEGWPAFKAFVMRRLVYRFGVDVSNTIYHWIMIAVSIVVLPLYAAAFLGLSFLVTWLTNP